MTIVDKKDCCGCSACVYACPKDAIRLVKDDAGFLSTEIDEERCVSCGKCARVCPKETIAVTEQDGPRAFSAAWTDKRAGRSASGGIFALAATRFIEQGGVVFGTEMTDDLRVRVACVTTAEGLSRLQGSKYVQSDMSGVYAEIKTYLVAGRPVLFGGTPCQCAALRNVFGAARGLYLMDIICHGVPNQEMFLASAAQLQEKRKKKIASISFRDKQYGQRVIGTLTFADGSREKLPAYRYDYYSLFLKNDILVEGCFSCRYAQPRRAGDLTIGDYWGVHCEDPAFFEQCLKQGCASVSAVLVNTDAGQRLWDLVRDDLLTKEADVSLIAKRNPNLKTPTTRGQDYEACIERYRTKGWAELSRYYHQKNRKGNFKKALFAAIPTWMLNFLKRRG